MLQARRGPLATSLRPPTLGWDPVRRCYPTLLNTKGPILCEQSAKAAPGGKPPTSAQASTPGNPPSTPPLALRAGGPPTA